MQDTKLGAIRLFLLFLTFSGVVLSHLWEPRTWHLIKDTGTVGRTPTGGGCMAIFSDNGKQYNAYEVVNLPSAFQERGTPVSFLARQYPGYSFCMWGEMIEILAIKQPEEPITSIVLTCTGWKVIGGFSLILTSVVGFTLLAWFTIRKERENQDV